MIVASLAFVTAAALMAGKETGSIPILSGAIIMCLLTLANPILYSGVMPRVIENAEREDIGRIYATLGLAINLCWAGSLILIAIGIFMRLPAAREKTR